MLNKQRIGLFGGTFDPIHIGHLVVTESVLIDLKLDLIYFIPAFKHAIKPQDKITSPDIRFNLLNIALQNYPDFKVSRIELNRNEVSYTVDTLGHFREYENLDNVDLFYIIGKDNLSELYLWKNPEQIMKLSTLVILRRSNTGTPDLIKKYKGRIIAAETPLIDISSTMIRKRIQEKKPWRSLVLPKVYDFIEKNQLYK